MHKETNTLHTVTSEVIDAACDCLVVCFFKTITHVPKTSIIEINAALTGNAKAFSVRAAKLVAQTESGPRPDCVRATAACAIITCFVNI